MRVRQNSDAILHGLVITVVLCLSQSTLAGDAPTDARPYLSSQDFKINLTNDFCRTSLPEDGISIPAEGRWTAQQPSLQTSVVRPRQPCLPYAAAGNFFVGADTSNDAFDPIEPRSITSSAVQTGEQYPQGVQWKPLLRHSFNYLGVMHAFRIATEAGTRDALTKNMFGGYFKALGSMHGWSDGDGYYENYLGHPLEGAVAAYIWIHNDIRYRTVEFGSSRDYWMSRLRAYGYAWAFSEQFEIGPISEASIGQIQRICCAYGFVDHIITPNGGLAWVVAGDALDRYVVRPIEDHSRNQAIRILARVALNPPLSFANLMAGQYPWHRETRAGIRDYDGEEYVRSEDLSSSPGTSESAPKYEVVASLPTYMRFEKLSCLGGGGLGAARVTDSVQWTLEVSGCTLHGLPQNWSGDSLTFTTGPKWNISTGGRWTPHFHLRFGGQKVTEEYVDPVLKQQVLSELPKGKSTNSVYDDYTTHYESTGLTLSIGGGADVRLSQALALRVANVEYVRSWLDSWNGADFNRGIRFSSGLILRIGTW
jgi:hypothetical protein